MPDKSKKVRVKSSGGGVVSSKTKCTKEGCSSEVVKTTVKKKAESQKSAKKDYSKKVRAGKKKVRQANRAYKNQKPPSKRKGYQRDQDNSLSPY